MRPAVALAPPVHPGDGNNDAVAPLLDPVNARVVAALPLFDAERAIRAGIREDPVSAERCEIAFGEIELIPEPDFTKITNLDFIFNPDVLSLLDGEIPDWLDLSGLVPDCPPEDWGQPAGEEPTS